LLTKVRIGVPRQQTCNGRRVCGSTPLASIDHQAASTAVSAGIFGKKSWWPGVSSRLITQVAVFHLHHRGNRNAALLDFHPVGRGMARGFDARRCQLDAPGNNGSFSVSVVLPASGWEMMANVWLA
jgi:hypothetical protein